MGGGQRPPNVGILALEAYVPPRMVLAAELEAADGVTGKYTQGLEQAALSYCAECEDTISIALTAMQHLLRKYAIDPLRIGRLEVGTESSPDMCKSVKSHLMRLLAGAGNTDVEGVDSIHGCYGGTAALFNAINWIESSSWDGRYAVVVATDVARYPPHSAARATGGAGAVALLLGPNAPLVVDAAWRSTYADNSQEFCKPAGGGPFPVFQPSTTLEQYMFALDSAYLGLYRRLQRLHLRVSELQTAGHLPGGIPPPFDVTNGILPLVDFLVCHAPYARLVRKGLARMALHDALRSPRGDAQLQQAGVPARWRTCEPEALPGAGYADKSLEAALLAGVQQAYTVKVQPGSWCQQLVGNAYTASLYLGLAGLWEQLGAGLEGRRVLLFAFGSGTQATFFSLVGRPVTGAQDCSLASVASKMQLRAQLARRTFHPPASYDVALQQWQEAWGKVPWSPGPAGISALPGDTWYLEHVDEKHRRHYCRRPTGISAGGVLPGLGHFSVGVTPAAGLSSGTPVNAGPGVGVTGTAASSGRAPGMSDETTTPSTSQPMSGTIMTGQ